MASVEVESDQVTVHIEGMDRSWRAPSQVFASGFGGRHGFHCGRGVPSDVTCAGGRHDFRGQQVRRTGRDRPLRRDHNLSPSAGPTCGRSTVSGAGGPAARS
jgi:hypothetical protein